MCSFGLECVPVHIEEELLAALQLDRICPCNLPSDHATAEIVEEQAFCAVGASGKRLKRVSLCFLVLPCASLCLLVLPCASVWSLVLACA